MDDLSALADFHFVYVEEAHPSDGWALEVGIHDETNGEKAQHPDAALCSVGGVCRISVVVKQTTCIK